MNCNKEQLNITRGSDINLNVTLIHDEEVINPLLIEGLEVNLISGLGRKIPLASTQAADYIVVSIPWSDVQRVSVYSLEVKGSINGLAWAAIGKGLIRYTNSTEAGADSVTVEADAYDVTMEVGYHYSDSPIARVEATIDDQVGTPSVDVSYERRVLVLDFHNLKGNGIADIEVEESIEDGGENVVTETFDDGTTKEFIVRNGHRGNGIASSSEDMSHEDGGVNAFTFTDDDGGVHVLHTRNGKTGAQGDSVLVGQGDLPLAHTLGQDNTKAMSQKGVTDAVGVISDELYHLNGDADIADEAEFTGTGRTLDNANKRHVAVKEGEKYAIVFSKLWEATAAGIGGSSYAFGAYHEASSTGTSESSPIAVWRPAQRPTSLRYEFTALKPYIYYFVRGNEGEEWSISIVHISRLEVMDGRIDELENEIESVENDLDGVRGDLDNLDDYVHEIIGDNILIKSLSFTGACATPGSTNSQNKYAELEVGKNYRLVFSNKTWSCENVKGSANAFFIYAVDTQTGSGGVEIVTWTRPSKLPDSLTYDFTATKPWLRATMRGDSGETLTVQVTEITEITQIKKDISELEDAVAELQEGISTSDDIIVLNGGQKYLSSIFQTLRKRKGVSGNASYGNMPFNLLYFSDLHGYPSNLDRLLEFRNAFSGYIDDVLHGGDSVRDKYSDLNVIADCEYGDRLLNVVGNHDVNDSSNVEGDSVDGILTKAKTFAKYIEPFREESGIVLHEDWETENYCFYYKDYSASKLRLVVLDCMHWETAQNDWLASVLAGAKTLGYAVICVDHFVPQKYFLGVRTCTFESLYRDYLANGFPGGQYLNSAATATVQNAINNGLEFVCWLFGHEHLDHFGYIRDYPQQYALSVDKSAPAGNGWERDAIRQSTGRSQDSFDIISVDTTLKVLTVMKVGNNMDKFLRQKNFMAFDYVNRIILSNS